MNAPTTALQVQSTQENYPVREIQPAPSFDLSPRSLDEAMRASDLLAKSDLIPKDYQGKPGNILVAMQWGAEIGLKPLQAMQNIAVINGRPSLWGDAQLALVRNSPHCEYVLEEMDASGTAICRAKRRGEPEQVRMFSVEDAKVAGLAGKSGPHSQYPKRMRQLRARAFALRDVFTDILKGIPQAEEVMDYPPADPAALPRNAPPAAVAAAAAPTAERTEAHDNMIADLEIIAKEEGEDALAAAWAKLSKEARRAIGSEELARLKTLAAPPAAAEEAAS